MKAIGIVKLCVALLLTIVLNGVRTESIVKILNDMAANGDTIDGIFKPFELLGSNGHSVTYRGLFLPLNIEVAMKFSSCSCKDSNNKEYRMYTYLDAVNYESTDDIAFGVPTIYYYGEWNHYDMLAMRLLRYDSDFKNRIITDELSDSYLLTIFREFVKVMKHIHSRGIIHKSCTMNKLIVQNSQVYINDFILSVEMKQYLPESNIKLTKRDFQKFLESMFRFVQPNWHWFGFDDDDAVRMKTMSYFVTALEKDAKANRMKKFTGMGRIFVEFTKHAYDERSRGIEYANGTWIPFHDDLYRVIIEEMRNFRMEITTPDLYHIPDPFGERDWSRPTVHYDSFQKKYENEIRDARKKVAKTSKSSIFSLKRFAKKSTKT